MIGTIEQYLTPRTPYRIVALIAALAAVHCHEAEVLVSNMSGKEEALSCPDILCGSLCRRYVKKTATPGDGLSWGTAFDSVQQGINSAYCDASQCKTTCQVWVAEGTYYIYHDKPEDTVRLRPGVHVYGGFAGSEATLEERDYLTHETILNGKDGPDGNHHVYQVVFGQDASRLDGFTVTGGRAVGKLSDDGEELKYGCGGGMYISDASPTVANCIFTDNQAHDGNSTSWGDGITGEGHNVGGGMYLNRSYSTVTNCTFADNAAVTGAGLQVIAATPTITDCTFIGNHANSEGGGLFSFASYLRISNSTFEGNSAGWLGGGLAEDIEGDGPMEISNCIFRGNEGGGLYLGESNTVWIWDGTMGDWAWIVNNTFHVNTGGAIVASNFEDKVFVNNIVWNNEGGEIVLAGSGDPDSPPADVTYSLVGGGHEGLGNIDADPMFADAAAGDLRLSAGSPCIDAADDLAAPQSDALGNPRVDIDGVGSAGVIADMGALEHQPTP